MWRSKRPGAERGIEDVRAIGGGHNDHRLGLREAVHFAEDLVECLFAFIVSAADACAAVPPDGVDFIDEQDGRGVFLGGVEQVADPARPHAHEHLDEFRAVDGEEGHPGLAGYGPGKEGFAGAWRAHQQDALGHAGAER